MPAHVPLHPRRTLGVHQHGRHDPTTRVTATELWRATRTPEGPGTLRLQFGTGGSTAQAWGDGSGWLLARLPQLLGEDDDTRDFVPLDPVVTAAARDGRGLRVGRSDGVLHALVPAVLGQRVTSVEAARQWRHLCQALGGPAPGPAPGRASLLLPPDPQRLARTPSWWFHRLGIERKRAELLVRIGGRADALEALAALPRTDAYRSLLSVRGIGPWTAAHVGTEAFGDPDAVAVGDYHLPHVVSYALTGRPRGDDALMLELLAPYAGHRGRVVRLLLEAGHRAPRFGPRQALLPVASW